MDAFQLAYLKFTDVFTDTFVCHGLKIVTVTFVPLQPFTFSVFVHSHNDTVCCLK